MNETLIANQNMSEFTECDIQHPVKNVQHQQVLKICFIHQSSVCVSLPTQPEWAVCVRGRIVYATLSFISADAPIAIVTVTVLILSTDGF